jgi:hypothetical protein
MRSATRLLAIAASVALGASAMAQGEVQQEGNLIVAFDGGISPRTLPRGERAPVTVTVESTITTSDGADPPPQLREITIAINRGGKLFDRGLPTCKIREIQPTTIRAARRICGGAIVGSGHVRVRVHLASQEPFTFEGPLLAFNAKPVGGKRRILAQIYGTRPPSAFVLPFKILRRKGPLGTVIRTALPQPAWKWAYITHFDMRLRRMYTYKGKRHSFVSAGCPAPAGFPGAVYPFAKGSFEFAGNRRIETTLIRDCKVR